MDNRLLPVLALCLLLSGCWPFGDDQDGSAHRTAEAIRETLVITSTESGTVEAEEKVVISNQLKWSVIIKKVVDEGTVVKQGQLIIEFECKNLEDAIDALELALNNAELALEQANKQLVLLEKQQTINLEQAKNAVKDAEENHRLYEEQSQTTLAKKKDALKRAEETLVRFNAKGGQRENDLRDAEIAIEMATKQVKIAEKKLEFKKDVNRKPELNKPYSESEIESDELALQNLRNTLEKAIAAKKLLETYTIPQLVRQLEEDIRQAAEELKILQTHTIVQNTRKNLTAIKEAKLKLEQAKLAQEAELRMKKQEILSKQRGLDERKEQMQELKEDQAKLRVTAERSGLVLYEPGWKGEGQRIEVKEGESIYPRGKLMIIPDMTTLRVQTMIFEALREYVTVEDGGDEGRAAVARIEAHVGQAVKRLMMEAIMNKWPKEKAQAAYLKIKTDQIIPMIKQAVTDGKLTKKDAKAFYRRLEESEARTAEVAGGQPTPVKIDWDSLPDAPDKKDDAASKPVGIKGTRAMVVLDSFARKTQIPGRVVESSPLPKGTGPHWLRTGTKAYDLWVGVDWKAHGLTPGKNLRPGMGGKVTLILDEIEDALTIPVLSVYNKKDKYYCMKIEGGSPVETRIEIGKMNESRVQILSGLKEGDKVLLVADADEEAANGEAEDEGPPSANGSGAQADR